jgi:hypothetical protein
MAEYRPDFLGKIEEDIQYAKATEHLVKDQRESLERLLSENLKYAKAIYADTQKIRRFMFWRMIINIVWILLIIAPIIVAFIFLPPALNDLYQSYQNLLGGAQGGFDLLEQMKQLK